MPKFNVYAIAAASRYVGEVEAKDKEEAMEKAYSMLDSPPLCYHCANNYELGDPDPLLEEIE